LPRREAVPAVDVGRDCPVVGTVVDVAAVRFVAPALGNGELCRLGSGIGFAELEPVGEHLDGELQGLAIERLAVGPLERLAATSGVTSSTARSSRGP